MNVIVAGPCGVGKSTIAQSFAISMGVVYLDFDELKNREIEEEKVLTPSAFSVSFLNLKKCLPPVLDKVSSGFILDFGGDTVFRQPVDNEERLSQVLWLKEIYSVKVALLVASKEILLQRFSDGKRRDLAEFDKLWLDWRNIAEPYWGRCADLIVDTSTLSVEDTMVEIKRMLFDKFHRSKGILV